MRSSAHLVLTALLLFACNEPERHRPRATSASEEPSPPEGTSTGPEVLPEARTVRFTTDDGVHIVGTLQPAARADAPAVVLVHQLGSDRSEWAPLLARLHQQPSLTTLAIDMRGHGESTEGPSGALAWGSFDDAAWTATRLDVRAAFAFLRSPASFVRASQLAAVGSSIGSSAVIAAAAEEPSLGALVTLSPGRAYHGFDAITPAISLGDRAILAIVSRGETDSVDTAEAYGRIGHVPPMIVLPDAHGVRLFEADAATLDRTESFLRERLGAPRVDAAPAPSTAAPAPSTAAPAPSTAAPDIEAAPAP